MHPAITAIQSNYGLLGSRPIVVAVPEELDHLAVLTLKKLPGVQGLVLRNPPPTVTQDSTSAWLGCFVENSDWTLPTAKGRFVFLGHSIMLANPMILRILRTGRVTVYCLVGGQLIRVNLPRILLERLWRRLFFAARALGRDSVARRSLVWLAHRPPVSWIWPHFHEPLPFSGALHASPQVPLSQAFAAILAFSNKNAKVKDFFSPVPKRVCLVNAGLAAGGAERQLVNTLLGLDRSGKCESVVFLGEYLTQGDYLQFFSQLLSGSHVRVHTFSPVTEPGPLLAAYPLPVSQALQSLGPALMLEILTLAQEFKRIRPEVVHAWQDSTSIKAGVAALLVGVPKVILSGRNVAPIHFGYIQDYMQPGYQALARSARVKMINNSEVGASDYRKWLGFSPSAIDILRNGVALDPLVKASEGVVSRYKQALGIPHTSFVVGSIFRFWPEKRPQLWIQVAKEVARRHPDIYFLLVGDGPMRSELESTIANWGLQERVKLPGTSTDISVPLSTMDVFLLTSKFEGTPNVVLEAQWLGLPTVVTDAGGTREAILDGVTGKLTDDASVEALVDAVEKFYKSPDARKTAQAAGPRFVHARFGLNRMVDETLALYSFGDDA